MAARGVNKTTDAEGENTERQLWQRYIAGGRRDERLRNELMGRALPRLRGVAQNLLNAIGGRAELEDLLQEGALGLVDAAARYEPNRGKTFFSFAYQRVLGRMIDWLRHNDHMGRHARVLEKQRRAVEHATLVRVGRRATPAEVCEALGWSAADYQRSECPQLGSLEHVLGEDDTGQVATWRELLTGGEEGPTAALETEGTFREALKGLDFDDQVLAWLYLVRGSTMKQIGVAMGISESRVSQRWSDVKRRLLGVLGRRG